MKGAVTAISVSELEFVDFASEEPVLSSSLCFAPADVSQADGAVASL